MISPSNNVHSNIALPYCSRGSTFLKHKMKMLLILILNETQEGEKVKFFISVILGTLLNLCFSFLLYNKENNNTNLSGLLWGLRDSIFVKGLIKGLVYSKHDTQIAIVIKVPSFRSAQVQSDKDIFWKSWGLHTGKT